MVSDEIFQINLKAKNILSKKARDRTIHPGTFFLCHKVSPGLTVIFDLQLSTHRLNPLVHRIWR